MWGFIDWAYKIIPTNFSTLFSWNFFSSLAKRWMKKTERKTQQISYEFFLSKHARIKNIPTYQRNIMCRVFF